MASVISAGTASNTALTLTSDTTGELQLKTNSGSTTALTLTTGGNINIPTTGARITGDFSNATISSRVMFQNSTTDANTIVSFIPNGTATQTNLEMYNKNDPNGSNNPGLGQILINSSEFSIRSAIRGSGTYLPLTMYTGGSERLRIDTSGNVGVGTTSTSGAKLTVRGAGTTSSTASFEAANSSGNTRFYVRDDGTTSFYGASFAETVRIDSSGNVGIGVTPSAWGGSFKALQVSTSSIYNNNDNDTFIGANYFWDGTNNKYISTTTAAAYGLVDGTHQWFTAPSGTAGNNVTFSERMRITSSGNVGIGTSGPTCRFDVNDSVSSRLVNLNSTGTNGPGVGLSNSGTDFAYFGSNKWALNGTLTDYGQVAVNNFIFGAGNTERMRIASNGQVFINATSAVVDSNSKFVIDNSVANGVAAEFSNNASGTGCVLINNSGAATATLVNWYAANAFRSSVTWNGTNIIYGTPSDQRLKENIVDSNSALPLINDIKIRSFDWKENGNHIDFGVIAQELESVMPEAVLKGKDNEDGSIKESWSVDTSTLVPALIKAIQEQQAMIEELKAEVALLKSK